MNVGRLTQNSALLALALAAAPWALADDDERGGFGVRTIAEGVHVFHAAPGDHTRTTSLVVEGDTGLLVVDAQPTPQAARELLRAIARVSDAPVRLLVYTHPHAEAIGGASAFPAGVVRIAAEGCAEALADPDFDFAAEARERLPRANEGAPAEPERSAPTLALTSKAVLRGFADTVELLPLRKAHTQGDLLVHLTGTKIVAVGDLVFDDRGPFGRHASLTGWVGALNVIDRLGASRVVALRAPDVEPRTVRVQRDAMAWLRGRVDLAFMNKVPREELADWVVDTPEIPERFGGAPQGSGLTDLARDGVLDALEHRRKRGFADY